VSANGDGPRNEPLPYVPSRAVSMLRALTSYAVIANCCSRNPASTKQIAIEYGSSPVAQGMLSTLNGRSGFAATNSTARLTSR
jgi:hypothetical protein